MLNVKDKIKGKKWLYSPLVFICLIILLLLLSRSAFGAYRKSVISSEAKEASARDLEDLESRKTTLQTRINSLNSADGIETEIRERFQVVRPGEDMIIVRPPKDTASSGN